MKKDACPDMRDQQALADDQHGAANDRQTSAEDRQVLTEVRQPSTPAFDPARAPLIEPCQTGMGLALPPSRLDGAWVRQRFRHPPRIWTPESIGGLIHAAPKPASSIDGAAAQPVEAARMMATATQASIARHAVNDRAVTVSREAAAGVMRAASSPVPASGVAVSAGLAAAQTVPVQMATQKAGVQPQTWGPSGALLRPTPIPAAVLVPLIPCEEGLGVLLTVRSHQLRKHRGQIAFPGGRIDAEDASPEAAALREAYEEIGLGRESVEVLGALPWMETGTGFRVRPVVGMLHESVQPAQLVLAEAEVAELFIVPLAFLMNPGHHQRRLASWQQGAEQVQRAFYAMPWRNPAGREYFIWGATAFMLRNLYHFLAAD